MALEGTLDTPVGKVPKKGAAIVGIGAVGVLGVVWYRSKQNAASAAQSSASTSATDQSNIDPATGFPYGSPEDIAAQQQTQAYSGGFGPVYGGGGPTGSPPGPGSFTSNAQWAQAAEDYLVNTVGEPPADVGNALGKYITGQPVTTDQEAFINQAIAFAGAVPVPASDGFPPSIRNAPPPPPPGSGGNAVNPVTGLQVHARFTQADVSWSPSNNATSYRVRVRTTRQKLVTQQTVKGTGLTLHNLPRNAQLEVFVLAQPAASGATPAGTSFHTER